MSTEKLEAGDFVQAFCKKCKKESKHVAVALTKGVPTKVQCTVCKGNHVYQKATESHAVSKARSDANKADAAEWQKLSANWNPDKAHTYIMGQSYKKGDLLNHKVFGLGIVTEVPGYNHMRVLFQEGRKLMQCGN